MAKDGQTNSGPQLVSFVGENLRTELKGKELHIIVPDVTLIGPESASGKSNRVSTSGGSRALIRLPDGQVIKGGINLFLPKPLEMQPTETATAE